MWCVTSKHILSVSSLLEITHRCTHRVTWSHTDAHIEWRDMSLGNTFFLSALHMTVCVSLHPASHSTITSLYINLTSLYINLALPYHGTSNHTLSASYFRSHTDAHTHRHTDTHTHTRTYECNSKQHPASCGVATYRRIDWIIGLFCRISSLL